MTRNPSTPIRFHLQTLRKTPFCWSSNAAIRDYLIDAAVVELEQVDA